MKTVSDTPHQALPSPRDTVHYLAAQLQTRGIGQIAEVCGDTENIQGIVERFSPISNRADPPIPPDQAVRVLIATDGLWDVGSL